MTHATPGPDDRADRHRILAAAGWLLILVILAAGATSLRWATAADHGTGDAFWYTRLAYLYLGEPDAVATARAGELVQRLGIERASPAEALVGSVDPRYPAIFAGRPLYPAIGALLIPMAGADAMILGALAGGVLAGVVLGAFAAWASGSRLVGVVALIAFYVLPSGAYAATVMADTWALTAWVATLAAASWFLRGGRRRAAVCLAVASVALGLAKSANAAAATVVFVGAAVVLGIWYRRRDPAVVRRALGAAAVSTLVTSGVLAGTAVLGLPGLEASLQDLFTAHFTKPDVADPYQRLVRSDLILLGRWRTDVLHVPGMVALAAVGIGGLIAAAEPWAVYWALAVPAAALPVLAHPVASEVPRLLAPAWASIALGIAMLLPPLRRLAAERWPGRRAAAA